jgi:hypothetical protein
MNNTENQSQNPSKKEQLKKLGQYTGTFLGASALVAAGVLTATHPGDTPQEQHSISKVNEAVPAAQKIQEGTVLVDRPNPRREVSPKPAEPTESPSSEATTPQPEVTTSHDKNDDGKVHQGKRPHQIDLGGQNVIVLTPPAETTSPEPVPTPEQTPSDTPTPIIVP